MTNIRFNADNSVSTILEYQKNIILNKECIKVLEKDGIDASSLKEEITELEIKIKSLIKVCEIA